MSEPNSRTVNYALAALRTGAVAGGTLGLADAALTLALESQLVSTSEALRVVALLLIANLTICTLSSLLISPLVDRFARLLPTRRWFAFGALVGAVGASAFDKWFFVHRYPYFHSVLALGFTIVGVIAASRLAHGTRARWLGPAVVVPILLGPLLGPTLGENSQLVKRVMASGSTVGGWMWGLWAPPRDEASAPGCAWPPDQPVKIFAPSVFSERPNVLLLSVDAVRGDIGGPRLSHFLPEISSAIPDAFRFDLAYAAATRTTESLFSMLTGRWPHRLDFRPSIVLRGAGGEDVFRILPDDDPRLLDPQSWKQHHPLPIADEHLTLSGALRANGYYTITAGASLFFSPGAGITSEFEVVDETAYQGVESGEIESSSFSSAALTDRLLTQIAEAPAGRPWFAWTHYLDPHAPYQAVSAADRASGVEEEPLNSRGRYMMEIRRVDREVGRLLATLEARGQLENTIIIVTSDHGEEFREHGGQYHGTTVYDELLHVPLLVRLPGYAGRVIDTRVSLIDLFPTVIELLSVEVEASFDGRSLLPLLMPDRYPSNATEALSSATRPVLGIATLHGRKAAVLLGPYKLIENPSFGGVELYDLRIDPRERRTIAEQQPEVVRHLRCLIAESGILKGARHP